MPMTKWLSGNQSGFCCYWALPPYGRLHLEEWLPSGFVKRGKTYKCVNHNMFLHLWNTHDSWVCKGKPVSQAWLIETQYPAAYWEPTAITAKSKSTVSRVPSSNATEAQWASNSITSLGCRRFFLIFEPHLSNWWLSHPEKYERQIRSSCQLLGKNMFQTTNQLLMGWLTDRRSITVDSSGF